MILAALNDYYVRLQETGDTDIAPPGYSREKISFEIVLTGDGKIAAVNDLRENNGKKPTAKLLSVPASFKRPGIGSKSFFLWDKTSYALGVGKNSERTQQDHAAFKAFHRELLGQTDDAGLEALLAFLDNWTPECYLDDPHFGRHGEALLDTNVVFRLEGELGWLHERAAARTVWSQHNEAESGNERSMCLVTGELAVIEAIHPAIKEVNGAQTSGASIVSFNQPSFASYGKNQGANAPVSKQAAFAYTTALNHLLRRDADNRQRLQIGDATVVFWAQGRSGSQAQAAEDLFADFLDPGNDDRREAGKLNEALQLVRQGIPLRNLDPDLNDDTRVFVLGLAPNASRLSIRFWEVDSLHAFAVRLAQHFEDLCLEPSPWRSPPPVWRLLLACAPSRDGKSRSEDVPPQLAGELTRAILTGRRYPHYLLGNLVMRLRADGDISGTRVALCKAVLARAARSGHKGNIKGAPPVSLDPDNVDPGYLLGRLFSVLEHAQQAALGNQVNATIRDRYYGAASATPAGIFPLLLRNAQHHLGRVRKDKPGFAVVLEKDIGDIVDHLGSTLPKSLGIEAQGHFAIGYYHQTRSRFKRKGGNEENQHNINDPEEPDA